MGALHEGHLSLISRSKSECDQTIVSIFVNPTQFGAGEDLDRYPRPLERDLELASSAGADVVYLPSTEEIYPFGERALKISVTGVSEGFEGEHRPGHFDGVVTVVARLFCLIKPTRAYFGSKDLQQVAVVRRLVDGLGLATGLQICPTVRAEDGLALSSRNAYLSDAERSAAPRIYSALMRLQSMTEKGSFNEVQAAIRAERAGLQDPFEIEYLDLIDAHSFTIANQPGTHQAFIIAARLGSTRLIDNVEARWPEH